MRSNPVAYRMIDTFAGQFALIQTGAGALRTAWVEIDAALPPGARRQCDLLPELADLLGRYFSGDVVDFADVPTPTGGPFHQGCWQACRSIGRGRTRTYAELAVLAGSTAQAARSAGQAMRLNPLPVIVPCHRVVGAGRRLYGYSGSTDPAGPELAVKRALLTMEGAWD